MLKLRIGAHIQCKVRTCPFKWENLVELLHCCPMTNTPSYAHTHTHTLSVTLTDKHAHTLTLVLISLVSLQWAHCSATLLSIPLYSPRHPTYNRISIASLCRSVWASVPVDVCVWLGPPRSSPWQPEQGVLSLCCHKSTGHRGHVERGTIGGTNGGCQALQLTTDWGEDPGWKCPFPLCMHTCTEIRRKRID